MSIGERRNQGAAGGHISGFPHEYTGPTTGDGLPHGIRCVSRGDAAAGGGNLKVIQLPNGRQFIVNSKDVVKAEPQVES